MAKQKNEKSPQPNEFKKKNVKIYYHTDKDRINLENAIRSANISFNEETFKKSEDFWKL